MTTNVTVVSVEDEMKGDVYSYAIIVWEMLTRKIPWAHRKLFLFFFSVFLFFFLFFFFLS